VGLSLRNLNDLGGICEQLEILDRVVPTGNSSEKGKKKSLKRDYVKALCDYYLSHDYPEGIPEYWSRILGIESPMLCNRMQNIKSLDVQKDIWGSTEWGFQEKMDGVRMLIYYSKAEGLHFFSRNVSLLNFRLCEYHNIWMPNLDIKALEQFDSFIIDTEIICSNPHISTVIGNRGVRTETMLSAVTALLSLNVEDSLEMQQSQNCVLKFCIFDTIFFNRSFLTSSGLSITQGQRDKVTKKIYEILSQAGVNCVCMETVYDTDIKQNFYKRVMESKGEGVIAKHKDGLYLSTDNRSHTYWIKLKRTISGSLLSKPLNDTIDTYICGFERGELNKQYRNYVGTFIFAVQLNMEDGTTKEHIIAKCSGIKFADRKDATIYDADTNVVKLNPQWLNRVYSVDGQNISPRSKTIRNARMIEYRIDKNAIDCTMSEHDLNALVF
jgi:ATP-dependent DNA ligase